MKLGQRWSRFRKDPAPRHKPESLKSAALPKQGVHSAPAENQNFISDALPDCLAPSQIKDLLRSKESHELEHLIERAVYHTATLRQLRERVRERNDTGQMATQGQSEPSERASIWLESNLDHTFEHWRYYLKTLEMIALARQSLRSLSLPEKIAVADARNATRYFARLPPFLE